MKRIPFSRTLLVLLVVGLLAGACGSDTKVGSGVKVDKKGKGGALRDQTTTTAPTTTTTVKTTTTAAKTTATTKPTTTTTAAAAIVIKIQDDEQGLPFQPAAIRVKPGSIVEWQNVGTKGVARQIKAADNAFRSPLIPPGGSWRWTANAVGTHDYKDETRPYAVSGKIQVG
ncbi:MAG TPA: hypothetical protein VGO92_01800 [Acidimicrobiales bacterium]|jgi:plastocyanin|nr:hypothetical protein [Acidimicrobiales bacterium]